MNAAFFPMAPSVKLTVTAYGADYPGYSYAFDAYNSIDADGLRKLRQYFDELAVKVRDEMGSQRSAAEAAGSITFSMADWIYADYFLLLARQMVQAARESLRDFKYPITKGQTSSDIVDWINRTGQLAGGEAYTLRDLFVANETHLLNVGSKLTIGVTHAINSESFNTIATKIFDGVFSGLELAEASALDTDILRQGVFINYPGKSPYSVKPDDSLKKIAQTLDVQMSDLLLGTTVLAQSDLLLPNVTLTQPDGRGVRVNSETFTLIAQKLYADSFSPSELALSNAANAQNSAIGRGHLVPRQAEL